MAGLLLQALSWTAFKDQPVVHANLLWVSGWLLGTWVGLFFAVTIFDREIQGFRD